MVREDILYFEESETGRLIGSKGATIKAIQNESGCNIKVESGKAILRGSEESLKAARMGIRKVIGGEGVETVEDLDPTSLDIIGRGTWIQDIMKEFNVEVNVGKRRLTIVPIDDDAQCAKQAKNAMLNKLQYLTELHEETIRCPRESVPVINEDKGISQLVRNGLIQLSVQKDDGGLSLNVKGLRENVNTCLKSIHSILHLGKSRDFIPLVIDLMSNCSQTKLNDIREDLQVIEKRYGVSIDFKPSSTQAVLSGEGDVAGAKYQMEELLKYYFPKNCASLTLDFDEICQYICGENEAKLVKMQRHRLKVSVDPSVNRLWVCGDERDVDFICSRIENDINQWYQTHRVIELPNRGVIGRIYGARGENIDHMQKVSGSVITVKDKKVIVESSSPLSLDQAEKMLLQIINR